MKFRIENARGAVRGSAPKLSAPAHSVTKSVPNWSAMTTFGSGTYNTGVSETDAEAKAAEDGQAGSLDPANVGENSHPHAVDHLVEGHTAAVSVIAHDVREQIERNDEELESLFEKVKHTAATAMEAIDEHTSAMRQWLVQRQLLRTSRLPSPARHSVLHGALLVALLFSGDWGLVALGFQVMGLSDRPWIPGIPFTDDLHLAALSAVLALIYLGHIVGNHVRRIEHDLEVRRRAGDKRDAHPAPAPFDYTWAITAFVLAVIGVFALSSIRAEYLQKIGVDANYWAFIGVQMIILAAAVGIGFTYANPEADRTKIVDSALEVATVERDNAVLKHTVVVGGYNALIDRRCAFLSMAGHHVGADAANVRGQIAAYKRRYVLAQLEPAQEQLFKQHLVTASYGEGELLAQLTGATAFPQFQKAVTQKVMDALAAALAEIATLRARIDQIEINKLDLPGVDELFTAPVDGNTAEHAGAPATLHPVRPSSEKAGSDIIGDDIAEESA